MVRRILGRVERRHGWWLLVPVALLIPLAGGVGSRPPEGDWVAVERRDLVIEVEVAGELEAVRSSDYGPPPLRRMREYKIAFLAPEGEEVEAGEPVLGFDTSELERRLLQAIADRDSAQKSLEKRERDLDVKRRQASLALAEAQGAVRLAQLKTDVPAEVVANQELQTARIDLRIAEAEERYQKEYLEYLEASTASELEAMRQERDRRAVRVAELERQIELMTVRARTGGTVLYHSDWQGTKKKVGDRAWSNEMLIEIPDLELMRARVEADEAQAGSLAVGQPARFRLDAHAELGYEARVNRISKTVSRRSWRDPRRVVRLELELAATDRERMKPGMRLQGVIETGRIENCLTLPLNAIVSGPTGPAVRVETPIGWRWASPELGKRNAELVEVRAGLAEGDRVLRSSRP